MLTTTLRCRRRSRSAPATIWSSPKTRPQLAIPKLVVRQMLPFRYRWLTTWKSAAAASFGSGR